MNKISASVIGAAAITVAAVTASATTSTADSRATTEPTVLTYKLANDVEQKHVDIGRKGDSVGDRYIAAVSLRSGGEIAGRLQNECTVLDNKYEGHLCAMALIVDGGSLTLQAGGVGKAVPNVDGRGDTYAVTGGTGVYAGAGGDLTPSDDGATVTLTLVP